ncbi:DUF4129 domain-containing protein [Nocardia callitridis]|uniref:Protein-glutamine gamma-glutamyltransferase-like C-terminal domain-containing protein n=1 Tax=Nocardia callitridis TaxID=648753 RepID=A0ABP9JY10_9NOCA
MSEEHKHADDLDAHRAPATPRLGPAQEHLAAAEHAASRRDFDRALRERFRAVLRGLEQRGMLEVRRSRTANETADDVTTALDNPPELHSTAQVFDEVVYGGRHATEDDYRTLEYLDRFSTEAPPPVEEPLDAATVEQSSRTTRTLPALPKLLRDPRFWGAIAIGALIGLLIYGVVQSTGAPNAPAPPPNDLPTPPRPRPSVGSGSDALWDRLPAPIFFGGLQFLIAGVLVVWWRGRRRGAFVPEPRPVEVPANELLAGQAAMYRRAGDHGYIAEKLRAATTRRVFARLGVEANTSNEQIIDAIASRVGGEPQLVGHALFGAVPDERTLELVAAQLEWIESEVR